LPPPASAKAPLFRYPAIGQIARLWGAIPVRRRQDEGGASVEREALAVAARQALARGEALLILPEGGSQGEPLLGPLRSWLFWAFLAVLVARDLRSHLLGRRRAIMTELQDLLRIVPGPVLDGSLQ